MYAIVKTGGQQFKVQQKEVLTINRVEGEAGAKLKLTDVLMVGDEKKRKIGTPFVSGAVVQAEIVRQKRGKKIHAFNYKAKKNIRKRWGHRQALTEVRITKITAGK